MVGKVLIKPLVTEKSERLSDKVSQYTFIVAKKANKIEIKKAIEEIYGVSVKSVNTIVLPGKLKSRVTKAGYIQGRVNAYKKAIVLLAEGEEINLFGNV